MKTSSCMGCGVGEEGYGGCSRSRETVLCLAKVNAIQGLNSMLVGFHRSGSRLPVCLSLPVYRTPQAVRDGW
jgi:hypothetical protein